MKKLCTILFFLLCASLFGHAQQINTVEYFFDTDPGYGLGKKITTASAMLDGDYNFDVSSLTTGIHTLNTRLKNTSNKWSILYQNTLFIENGTAGPAQIITAEYYYDTDPGFGKGKQITLAAASLDSTLQFSVTGLITGPHTLYVRLKNNSNAWSTIYQGSFLLSTGSAGSSLITGAEYYFDTDPGVGHATQIAFSSHSIDSIINFSVNGLQPGIHTFYVRLKNSVNNWSFINQGNFVLFNGASGTPQIQTLNYFIDSVQNNIAISLNPKALLDTTISLYIPDNGTDKRVLGLRLSDQAGRKGNAELNDIRLCDLYKPQAGFRYAQYGKTFSLIDTSKFNASLKTRWLANDVLIDSNYTINYAMPITSIPGSVTIKELAGTGCRVDTAMVSLNMPGVESYAPYRGSYNSDFDLNLYGEGLDTNLVVYLQKDNVIVYPYMKFSSDGNQHLIAVFDFHGYAKTFGYPEIYDSYSLHVKYANGYEFTSPADYLIDMEKQADNTKLHCPGAQLLHGNECINSNLWIRVQDPDYQSTDSVAEPFFATDLTGPDRMRTGIWNNYKLSITNTGTVVAKGVPFYIMVPASFDIDIAQWNLFNPDPAMTDSIGVITPIDTVINGRHLQYKLIAMIYPSLGPGETGYFPLRIRTNANDPFHIYYAVQGRMFGSPMTYFFGPCWGAVFDFGIGFIPGVSCFYAFGNLINDQINFGLKNNNRGPDWFALGLSYVGTGISCIPGGGPLKQMANATAKEMGFVKASLGSIEDGVNVFDKGMNIISNGNSVANSTDPCDKVKQKPKKKDGTTFVSFDPNNITGNSDYDNTKHYINNYSPQQYTISFENKPSATANAQHVYITDTLNAGKLNIFTLKLGTFTIADSTYKLPAYRQRATMDVSLKSRNDMKVRFVANFDTAKGILQADFFSIDTLGNVLPQNSPDGFLPPDADGVIGTANISYTVYAQNLNTLDSFSNKAAIYFDNNAPIATNTWQNTVDTTRPQGKILNTITVNDSTVKLVMQGSDVGAGLAYHTFYAKASSDTVFTSIGMAVGGTVIFKGKPNKVYQLFSKATDNVGNIQQKDAVADVTVIFTEPLPVHLLSFAASKENTKVKLVWGATNEINFSHYEVEKSADAVSFTKITSVAAKGGVLTNNYLSYDEHPFVKSNYYRLKEVNSDNTFTYSKVVRLDFDKDYTLNVSPDPAHDYVTITGAENFTTVQFIDISGKIVKQFSTLQGNKFNIANLTEGMYVIRLSSDTDSQVLKLIKN